MKTPKNEIPGSAREPVVQTEPGQGLAPESTPNTGSNVSGILPPIAEDVAVEEPVTWPVPAYQVTDDVKCHGYYCRDCCQCGRYSVTGGLNQAALWARKDMDSPRCEHFQEKK